MIYDEMEARPTPEEERAEAWEFWHERANKFEAALYEVKNLEPQPYVFPADWSEQIDACPECHRYRDHPIQQGICDTHRRPLYERERHDSSEQKAIGPRARIIARSALSSTMGEKS